MKVILTRPWHGRRGLVRGDEVDVDDETAEFLRRVGGALSPEDYAAASKPAPRVETKAPEEDLAPVDPDPQGAVNKRPPRSASIEKWQEWAKAEGYDVKGLTKQELIALQ